MVLAGFLLISALANIGNNYAVANTELDANSAKIEAALADQGSLGSNFGGSHRDEIAADEDGSCACKSDIDSKKFTCGVTLALPAQSDGFEPIPFQKSRVSCFETTGFKSFVDLLKKPPRTFV